MAHYVQPNQDSKASLESDGSLEDEIGNESIIDKNYSISDNSEGIHKSSIPHLGNSVKNIHSRNDSISESAQVDSDKDDLKGNPKISLFLMYFGPDFD